MATRLALRIQNRIEQLSPSERRLAMALLERHDDPLVYSATELAEQAGVSKATAARLFRSLGYRDFNEVRLEAREERNRSAPDQRIAAPAAAPTGATAVSTHLQVELANLTRTFEEVSTERLRRAAHALAHAETVWVAGYGAEAGLAAAGRVVLARARTRVHLLGAAPGALAEELAMVGPRDALLVVALRARRAHADPVVDWARSGRVAVVALTDPSGAARLERLGALTLVCHAVGQVVGPSGTAAASLLRLLAILVAETAEAGAIARAPLISAIEEEIDVSGA
jgi:DNA-binding MurR/RpiR family transcriptional regulator